MIFDSVLGKIKITTNARIKNGNILVTPDYRADREEGLRISNLDGGAPPLIP